MDQDSRQRHSSKRQRLRSRSRSPYRHDRDVKRSRSRSPHRHRYHHSRHHKRERSPRAALLPFQARHLHKRDLEEYWALLAEYLDLQKGLDVRGLGENEVKGRWKSFLRKWNAGELAEGWYDPEMKKKADSRAGADAFQSGVVARRGSGNKREPEAQNRQQSSEDESDDGYGPALPEPASMPPSGPAAPSLQDLKDRDELNSSDRATNAAHFRALRKADAKQQKERLDELAPRAAPGTRERHLEKKRDVAYSNRAFAESKEGGAEDVGEGELMGDEGAEGFKRRVKEEHRKKSEREVRKEEVLRARAAEREERVRKVRAKEEETMGMLREIARQRFGSGAGGG